MTGIRNHIPVAYVRTLWPINDTRADDIEAIRTTPAKVVMGGEPYLGDVVLVFILGRSDDNDDVIPYSFDWIFCQVVKFVGVKGMTADGQAYEVMLEPTGKVKRFNPLRYEEEWPVAEEA